MKNDPFALIQDARTKGVLERLHTKADKQTPGLLLHYLPKIPWLLLGQKIHFKEAQLGTFYADKYIALEPQQAAYCYLVARSLKAKCIVEFGTSFGISTIWLAAAVRANGGGKVIGTEIVPAKAEQAQRNIDEAGLSEYVEIRQGDATTTLKELPDGVDMLLNDGFPTLALDIVKLVAPRMREGGVVITDNVGMFQGNYAEYIKHMRNPDNGFASMLLPFKSGTELSVRTPQRPAPEQ